MVCLILGIIMMIVGVISLYVGIGDGDVVLIILGAIFTLPSIFAVLAMMFVNTEKSSKIQEVAKKRFEDKIVKSLGEENVEVTQQYRTFNHSVIGLDEINRKICFLNSNSDWNNLPLYGSVTDSIKYSPRTFQYKDVLESEVILDGETLTKTSRSSQVGGAILGSILAGGVGAIIGGKLFKRKGENNST